MYQVHALPVSKCSEDTELENIVIEVYLWVWIVPFLSLYMLILLTLIPKQDKVMI